MTSVDIIYWSLFAAQTLISIAMLLVLWRLILGPNAQDRIMALDALYVMALMLFVIFGIKMQTAIYFEVALLIGLVGFASSAALAKFLMRGEVIE